jgi:hypothetical protein
MDSAWSVDEETQGAWGVSARPQLMLSVRFVDGNRRFFSYAELGGGACTKDVLALYFYQATLRIRGRGLEELADQIERQGVRFIKEQHVTPFEAKGIARYIERIEVGPPAWDSLQERRTG